MARIKSAWEIALEKTADLKVDTKKIQHDKFVKQGSQITGSYINNIDFTLEDFTKIYENHEQKSSLNEGVINIVLLNITLPIDDSYSNKILKLKNLCTYIQPKSENLPMIFEQMEEYFKQYLIHQDDLIKQMKEQYAPALAQKQAQMQQKYGPDFVLQPEQDQEFMKLAQDNLKKLEQQYMGVLTDVKAKIKEEILL